MNITDQQAAINARAQLLLDAAAAAPALTIDPAMSDADVRRMVVRAVLGDAYAASTKSDDYVLGCFQLIKEDGRVAPSLTHHPAWPPAGRPRY